MKIILEKTNFTLLSLQYIITSQLCSGIATFCASCTNYSSIVSLTLMVLFSLNKAIMSLSGQNLAWIITNESNMMLQHISYVCHYWKMVSSEGLWNWVQSVFHYWCQKKKRNREVNLSYHYVWSGATGSDQAVPIVMYFVWSLMDTVSTFPFNNVYMAS